MENIVNNSISIITISYNCKDDLEKTIQSVLSQSYIYKEYIIVDGGSSDGTEEILKKYRDVIDVCICEHDDGIYDALNKGVKKASGEWIICMNAGDVFASDNVLENILGKNIPQTKTFLYSDFCLVYPDGRRQERITDRNKGEIHHQNAIYRRSLHQTYGYYIVTHPYIVSDLLFFLAIPESQYLKVEGHIADVKAGGVSDNLWCLSQSWAAKVIYGIDTIPHIFYLYVKTKIALCMGMLRNKLS